MTSMRGNDRHGPGGDPSWLGGEDRSSDVGRDAGSADGAGADSDFGTSPQSRPDQQWAPRFGEPADEGAATPDQDRPDSKSIAGRVLAVLGSSIGLIVLAVVVWRMGFDQWWIVLFVGIPLIQRVVRVIRKNLGK